MEALIDCVELPLPDTIVKTPIGPTAEASVIDPVPAVRVSALLPVTVLETRILPLPTPVLREEVPVNVIGLASERLELLVAIDPLRLMALPIPPLVCVKKLAAVTVPPIV